MALAIASLNSGSNANCYYVGNQQDAVLIDAGLSCRETEKRMKQLELSMERVRAIFISHEHSDHVTGLAGLSRKYKLPVYITPETRKHCTLPLEEERVQSFTHNKAVQLGSLSVLPFRKHHDGVDPHSFTVSCKGIHVGVITDIGFACKQVIKQFSRCHAVFLESNYCPDMLEKGSYPWHLKKRISGDDGHLSNHQALELFQHYRPGHLRLLILSHLSKNNNDPKLVEELFRPHAGTTEIVVASRYAASPVFMVDGEAIGLQQGKSKKATANQQQLSLF